jgi:hypothetical protein
MPAARSDGRTAAATFAKAMPASSRIFAVLVSRFEMSGEVESPAAARI